MQIAKGIFSSNLQTMKSTLNLIAFKVDKKSEIYAYYKQEIMSYTYRNLKKLFKQLEEKKIIEKCKCSANLKQGYKSCPLCGGCGFCNRKN